MPVDPGNSAHHQSRGVPKECGFARIGDQDFLNAKCVADQVEVFISHISKSANEEKTYTHESDCQNEVSPNHTMKIAE